MRILFNASKDTAHPNAGGSEVYMNTVMQGLHDRGHQVHLSAGGPVDRHDYGVSNGGGTFDQFLRSPVRLRQRRRNIDLVVDVANGMTFYSPLVFGGPTICMVHHIHTDMWADWFSPPVAAFGRVLERRAMPLAYRTSLFVAVSQSTSDELVKLGVDRHRIRLVHNATDVPERPAAPTNHTPLFVAVGRLVPHKRFHLLLERWPEIRAATGGRLVIIGEGPERPRLEALLSEGATLAGKVTDDQRNELLARATALVHPSYVEGWGLVVMEAAAQGTPSIGFDVPGMRDSIVAGSTGWLAGSLDHFVDLWLQTARRSDLAAAAGDAARTRAHQFGAETLVRSFESVALEAVNERVSVATKSILNVGRQPVQG